MKYALIVVMMLSLAACSSPKRFENTPHVTPASAPAPASVARIAPVASGPISQACLSSNRKARTRALCGCIQYAANETLTASQQSRAVTFYSDPAAAQSVRQSDRASDERFWEAYRAYEERAEAICR